MLKRWGLLKGCLFVFTAILFVTIFDSCGDKLTNPKGSQLKIISPNGGESLTIDSAFTIRWESQGTEKVDISFSADSGETWQLISQNLDASTGIYLWTIPDTITNNGLIRISTPDASFQDVSDSCFRIFFSREYIKEVTKYYPLKVGYVWVSVENVLPWFDPPWQYIVRKEVLKDSLINDKKFSLVSEISIPQDTIHTVPAPHYIWVRVDSSEGLIYTFGSDNTEHIFIDLKMRVGDIIEAYGYGVEVLSEENAEVLGILTDVKNTKRQIGTKHTFMISPKV